jgi:hypothetical protein
VLTLIAIAVVVGFVVWWWSNRSQQQENWLPPTSSSTLDDSADFPTNPTAGGSRAILESEQNYAQLYECPSCGGRGEIIELAGRSEYVASARSHQDVAPGSAFLCTSCDGSGLMPGSCTNCGGSYGIWSWSALGTRIWICQYCEYGEGR